jgi:hypothetical protein
MNILLVEPDYYTRYPPLGLLKVSAWRKDCGDEVSFVRGTKAVDRMPEQVDRVYITSLFTYSWRPVHAAVAYYRKRYPGAHIVLGGIYATLMPEHARLAGADEVHTGLIQEAEGHRPDYSLVPEWDSSIMFSMRGCIRKCAFCAVPRLEGKITGRGKSVRDFIAPGHKKAVLWDNNILGVPNWQDVIEELASAGVSVDFNQGLDARLITPDVATQLARLKIPLIRMAYDIPSEGPAVERAIDFLERVGFSRRKIVVYTLYNFTDTPDDFWRRVHELLEWGAVSYPMRYEPLNSLTKNRYISPHWTPTQVETVAAARRVLGVSGAFPPYEGLRAKLREASSFEEAFGLRTDGARTTRVDRPVFAGTVEPPTEGLDCQRAGFRDLYNDPMTLSCDVACANCGGQVTAGERAFAIQDYGGKFVGYLCPTCHPNRKWINGLWRSVLGEAFTEKRPLVVPVIASTVHGSKPEVGSEGERQGGSASPALSR